MERLLERIEDVHLNVMGTHLEYRNRLEATLGFIVSIGCLVVVGLMNWQFIYAATKSPLGGSVVLAIFMIITILLAIPVSGMVLHTGTAALTGRDI